MKNDMKERHLQVVEFKRIRDEIGPASEFLRSHLKAPIRTRDSVIEIEGAGHEPVKLLLHKFLHQRGLGAYKVHSQSGVLEIIPHEEKEDRESKMEYEGRPPTAPETMPYFFPSRAS